MPPQAEFLAIFFTPRCHRSGSPANSPVKIVVEVPSVIDSMLTLANWKAWLFITPAWLASYNFVMQPIADRYTRRTVRFRTN